MKRIIIKSDYENSVTIYQIEVICSKYGKRILFSAFVNKDEANKQIEWYIKNNYKEDVFLQFGKIYEANIREITLFA